MATFRIHKTPRKIFNLTNISADQNAINVFLTENGNLPTHEEWESIRALVDKSYAQFTPEDVAQYNAQEEVDE